MGVSYVPDTIVSVLMYSNPVLTTPIEGVIIPFYR